MIAVYLYLLTFIYIYMLHKTCVAVCARGKPQWTI